MFTNKWYDTVGSKAKLSVRKLNANSFKEDSGRVNNGQALEVHMEACSVQEYIQ